MPLNPPSYAGQDVWYSPNTYVNQVPVALWQPAVPMSSGLSAIPNIPNPAFTFNQQQLDLMAKSGGSFTITDANGKEVTTNMTDAPNADAPPGQLDSLNNTRYASDPVANNQGGYNMLISNLAKAARDAKGGGWPSNPSAPNIQEMLRVTGAPSSVIRDPRTGSTAWCATFVGYMLKLAGFTYIKTSPGDHINTAAPAYLNYGQAIDTKNPRTWRQGDVITVGAPSRSGCHVAFVWGINGNTPVILGGNQGDTVAVTIWRGLGTGDTLAVRRAWTVPPEADNYETLLRHTTNGAV
jgi:hypothetical protein